ncbi:MAG: pyruvate, phosphate dikinase [Bacteroidota bacterium]
MSDPSFLYRFGPKLADGEATMKALLGGKGASLAEMSRIGLPVPPGFTIPASVCQTVNDAEGRWPDGLASAIREGLAFVESTTGKRLGDPSAPLLLSVRSGAAQSMPGMMDTVLNLGLNEEVAEGLATIHKDTHFAYDAYRRFIDMFGHVVMGVPRDAFQEALSEMKAERGVQQTFDLTAGDLRLLVDCYKAIYRQHTGFMFPEDPQDQLRFAINAVFASWMTERAIKYRRINKIRGLLGTAVNVQAMVFGNRMRQSGTGVCFTRNPATGAHTLYGEFLLHAQGEDVVAGIRTPQSIQTLAESLPEVHAQLVEASQILERHYRNMQDIEFTVEEGQLYILQTRNGKRTGPAALKIAVDMVAEGLVTPEEAVRDLVEPRHLEQLLHPRFANTEGYAGPVLAQGLPASPGAAVGQAVFTSEDAEQWRSEGKRVILVRVETSPDDVGGMHAAQGILTSRGGMTSHAAVVARGWGTPCVAGCDAIIINQKTRSFTNGHVTIHEGDWISVNGSTGEIIQGRERLVDAGPSGDYADFMEWVQAAQTMKVRANADTPEDAQQAREFGARGIGLCRTEHMFFAEGRLPVVRRMILAETEAARRQALADLLPLQRSDFEAILKAMAGYPVTIRLLDPPLHEFLPSSEVSMDGLADALGLPVSTVSAKVEALRESNPMLGHRGCRLGITRPGLTAMQARAIAEAALNCLDEGIEVHPEIMIPLASTRAEIVHQRQIIENTLEAVYAERGTRLDLRIGTMIETPRAALVAGDIAQVVDFFSFGTNDLTQMTFGFSRDDTTAFLPHYVNQQILPDDPFQAIDVEGVGALVRHATEQGRAAQASLTVGLCGEHGGDPDSVSFCHGVGLDYVSCSAFRVPIARLAAAQAALRAAAVENLETA